MDTRDTSIVTAIDDLSESEARKLARRIQVGEFLRRELERRNWSQGTLAEKASCDQTTVSKIINAKHQASAQMVQRLLMALGMSSDTLDSLPSTDFDAGSDGFRLKSLIVRAVLENTVPDRLDTCARLYISRNWDDEEYRELPRTPNLEDAVWASCVAEGYFKLDEGRYHVDYEIRGHLRYFLTSYISHASSAIHRMCNTPNEVQARLLNRLISAFDSFEVALANPHLLVDIFEEINLSLSGNDRLLASIFIGYSHGFRFFLQAAVSTVYHPDHYSDHVQPLLACLLRVLRKAVHELQTTQPIADWQIAVDSYVEELGTAITDWADRLGKSSTSAGAEE